MEIIKPGSSWDFMGKRKFFLTMSAILVLGSIVSLVLFG